MGTAFQITADDVECVLHAYTHRMINTRGQSIVALSEELLDELDTDRIEDVALNASTDLDEQATAAHEEIHKSLVELGVLEF